MLATRDSAAMVEKVSTPYTVQLHAYDKPDCYSWEVYTVARFVAKGDAIAYAIWRAHTVPEGTVYVFEVYKGKKRVYRAG